MSMEKNNITSFAIFCTVVAENVLTATCSLKGSLHMFNLWALIHIWFLRIRSCKYYDTKILDWLIFPQSRTNKKKVTDMPRNRTWSWQFIMLSDHNRLQKRSTISERAWKWYFDSLKLFRFIDDTREGYANDLINAFCFVSSMEECIFDAICMWLILFIVITNFYWYICIVFSLRTRSPG